MGILTKRELAAIEAMRRLIIAVERAEDNDYSETSRKELSVAADAAANVSVRYPALICAATGGK